MMMVADHGGMQPALPQQQSVPGLIGITEDQGGVWRVRVRVGGGKRLYIGRYTDVGTAARVYDRAAVLLLGPHAPTNFGAAAALADVSCPLEAATQLLLLEAAPLLAGVQRRKAQDAIVSELQYAVQQQQQQQHQHQQHQQHQQQRQASASPPPPPLRPLLHQPVWEQQEPQPAAHQHHQHDPRHQEQQEQQQGREWAQQLQELQQHFTPEQLRLLASLLQDSAQPGWPVPAHPQQQAPQQQPVLQTAQQQQQVQQRPPPLSVCPPGGSPSWGLSSGDSTPAAPDAAAGMPASSPPRPPPLPTLMASGWQLQQQLLGGQQAAGGEAGAAAAAMQADSGQAAMGTAGLPVLDLSPPGGQLRPGQPWLAGAAAMDPSRSLEAQLAAAPQAAEQVARALQRMRAVAQKALAAQRSTVRRQQAVAAGGGHAWGPAAPPGSEGLSLAHLQHTHASLLDGGGGMFGLAGAGDACGAPPPGLSPLSMHGSVQSVQSTGSSSYQGSFALSGASTTGSGGAGLQGAGSEGLVLSGGHAWAGSADRGVLRLDSSGSSASVSTATPLLLSPTGHLVYCEPAAGGAGAGAGSGSLLAANAGGGGGWAGLPPAAFSDGTALLGGAGGRFHAA